MNDTRLNMLQHLSEAAYTVGGCAKLLDHLLTTFDTLHDQDIVYVFISALYHAETKLRNICEEYDDQIRNTRIIGKNHPVIKNQKQCPYQEP